MKNKLIKKPTSPTIQTNHKTNYVLFYEDRPRKDLTLREIYVLEEHPEYKKYMEALIEETKELNESNEESKLDEISDLLEKLQDKKIYHKSDIDIMSINSTLRKMSIKDKIYALLETKSILSTQSTELDESKSTYELAELLESVDDDTQEYIFNKINESLENDFDALLETDIQQVKDDILSTLKRFMNETEPSFFIRTEIIDKLCESELFLNQNSAIHKELRDDYNEVRRDIMNKSSQSSTYFNKVNEALESINPVEMPKINPNMTESDIKQTIKNNSSSFLYEQVLSKIKATEILKNRKQKAEDALQNQNITEEEISNLKNIENKELKEDKSQKLKSYAHVLKAINKYHSEFYKNIGISEDYDKNRLNNTIDNRLAEPVILGLSAINKLSEVVPLDEFINYMELKTPNSFMGAKYLIDEIRNSKEYKTRNQVITDKISQQGKKPEETSFNSKDDFETIVVKGYKFRVKPKSDDKNVIQYEIAWE